MLNWGKTKFQRIQLVEIQLRSGSHLSEFTAVIHGWGRTSDGFTPTGTHTTHLFASSTIYCAGQNSLYIT